MSDTIGVATSSRSSNGTRYVLTDDHSRVIGAVEVTPNPAGDLFNVRDRFDDPISVSDPRWPQFKAAVLDFTAWQAKH